MIDYGALWEQHGAEIADLLMSPPGRTATIKEGWRVVKPQWPTAQIEGRLMVCHDLQIIEPMLFEQIKYGETWVIECEGVIVERLNVIPAL